MCCRQEWFNTNGAGLWNLYVCLTTANHPDIIMPLANHFPWTVWIFTDTLCAYWILGVTELYSVIFHADNQRSASQYFACGGQCYVHSDADFGASAMPHSVRLA